MGKVLQFENISKLYRLGQVGTGTLSHDINRWWKTKILRQEDPYIRIGETNRRSQKGKSDFVWALRDISFSVDEGDVVGIIGLNGSGKSTLLKILSRITTPTTGCIKTKGRIASLLEVGTGFHSELSGRDNIYMNGSILGMTKREITSKFDEIVDFSGVARYIDTPVKRYSSGMKVRLGFAVAAFLDPEILVVDEVLAVGDVEFQKRAIGKMQNISAEQGRTVLFVSHNMDSMLRLCNKGLLLDEGELRYDGGINETVAMYVGNMHGSTCFEGIDGKEDFLSLQRAVVTGKSINGNVFENTSPILLEMEVDVRENIKNLVIGFNLMSQYETNIARADYNDVTSETTLAPGRYLFRFEIPAYTLAPGNYRIVFDLGYICGRRCYSSKKSNLYFEVIMGSPSYGHIYLKSKPKLTSLVHPKWIKSIECLERH